MTPRHWSQIGEVTFVSGIKLLFMVHRLLGRWPFRFFVYPTVFFYLLRYPAARAASHEYLERIGGVLSPPAAKVTIWRMLQHFAAFAESILDKLRIWSGELRFEDCTLHEYHHIADAKASGKGGLLVVSHLGNAEICRALSTRGEGTRMTVLVHTKHAQVFNALLAELNPRSGMDLLQVTEMTAETVMAMEERIARGGFVVIAGDRVPVSAQPRVASTEFLGAPASFPIGPYVLASLLQCPVYLVFCLADRGVYDVYFERFRDRVTLPRATRDAALSQLTADFAARLTHYCRLAPLQWFNFYDFWAPTPPPPANAHR
jgi:predicted LPLAT superfamily acyltransferase